MKKQGKQVVLTFLTASLLIGFSTVATAQVSSMNRNNKQTGVIQVAEFERVGNSASPSAAATADVRASKNFSKEFAGVVDANWTKTSNGYIVHFTQDGIQNQAFLTRKGNSRTTVRYYTEKDLPAAVRKQVKNVYADFNITAVTEVHMNNLPTAYLITITGLNTWKEIRVVDGEMDVRAEYVKG